MGMKRTELACLSLLLVMMMLIELEITAPCFADSSNGYNKFSRFKGRSHHTNSLKTHQDFKELNGDTNGGDVFGAEKRKVSTGPNPLHNR